MSIEPKNPWDQEYRHKGIPSSRRDEPSGVVRWAMGNWKFLTGDDFPATAVDVGCGVARNANYIAGLGAKVLAFDSSTEAIQRAREQFAHPSLEILSHDLRDGIPSGDGSRAFVCDTFVYKHQMAASDRFRYRQEIWRVMSAGGVLLLSLAHVDDGFYSQCPRAEGEGFGAPAIIDPVTKVGSVLFDLPSLIRELSDTFQLVMYWDKTARGEMHGSEHVRRTMATLWCPMGQ